MVSFNRVRGWMILIAGHILIPVLFYVWMFVIGQGVSRDIITLDPSTGLSIIFGSLIVFALTAYSAVAAVIPTILLITGRFRRVALVWLALVLVGLLIISEFSIWSVPFVIVYGLALYVELTYTPPGGKPVLEWA